MSLGDVHPEIDLRIRLRSDSPERGGPPVSPLRAVRAAFHRLPASCQSPPYPLNPSASERCRCRVGPCRHFGGGDERLVLH
jgi:hypothetical protein